jgi:hypothetical protein
MWKAKREKERDFVKTAKRASKTRATRKERERERDIQESKRQKERRRRRRYLRREQSVQPKHVPSLAFEKLRVVVLEKLVQIVLRDGFLRFLSLSFAVGLDLIEKRAEVFERDQADVGFRSLRRGCHIPLAKGACVFSLSSSSVNFLKSFEEEKREEVLRFLRKTRVNKDHNNVSLLS